MYLTVFLFWLVSSKILNCKPITTNSVEAWHRYMNANAKISHPNIAKSVPIIRNKENKTLFTIYNL